MTSHTSTPQQRAALLVRSAVHCASTLADDPMVHPSVVRALMLVPAALLRPSELARWDVYVEAGHITVPEHRYNQIHVPARRVPLGEAALALLGEVEGPLPEVLGANGSGGVGAAEAYSDEAPEGLECLEQLWMELIHAMAESQSNQAGRRAVFGYAGLWRRYHSGANPLRAVTSDAEGLADVARELDAVLTTCGYGWSPVSRASA